MVSPIIKILTLRLIRIKIVDAVLFIEDPFIVDNYKAITIGTKETKRKLKDLELENKGNLNSVVTTFQPVNVCDISEQCHDEFNAEINNFECSNDSFHPYETNYSMKTTTNEFEKFQTIGDGRQLNKGSAHRKSYPNPLKKCAISLKDCGLSSHNIAQILGTAKSNVEKWCSKKVNKIFSSTSNKSLSFLLISKLIQIFQNYLAS